MLLADLVAASNAVASTRSRTQKVALLADCLRAMAPDEVEVGASYLAGVPRQPRLDVGWATVRDVAVAPAEAPRLTLHDVDRSLDELVGISGPGSKQARHDVLDVLLGAATADEQQFLRGLILGEIRQGALEGVVVQAIARAFDLPEEEVRRATMLRGDLGAVARGAATGGRDAVRAFRLTLFQPLQPMLAQTAGGIDAAIAELGSAAVDHKLDGARVQVHRDGGEVRLYTRSLREVTDRLPGVVEAVRGLDAERIVLDGEVLALWDDGRPRAFQDTMSRFGAEELPAHDEVEMRVYFFDVLHLDGQDLLDEPLATRREALARAVPEGLRVPGRVVDGPGAAREVLEAALRVGHEGVMVKALDAPYEAGRRGAGWRKVKPVHTLDLVILAAEWGSGRRKGWLSNLHLGARDPGGGFVMLGKTFKGLTDELLAQQTERFLALESGRDGHVVHLHPEVVYEIAFDGVQTSRRYPGGVTLRFARVKGPRPDKGPQDADTIDTVRAIHAGEVLPDIA